MSPSLQFFEWSLDPKQKTLRLLATNEDVVLIIYLTQTSIQSSSSTTTFDIISKKYFHDHNQSGTAKWIHPKVTDPWKASKGDHTVVKTILNSIGSQLPDALRTFKTKVDRPLTGSFLYVSVEGVPDATGEASLTVLADIHREYVLADLQVLPPSFLSDIPRIDTTHIVRYLESYGRNVLKVLAKVQGKAILAVLKIANNPVDWEGPERTERSIRNGRTYQSHMLEEIKNVDKISGHPNTADSPLALVTIRDEKEDCLKLVGWLQQVYENWTLEAKYPHKCGDGRLLIPKRIGYTVDLLEAIIHMQAREFTHPDVHVGNLLLKECEDGYQLVIIDADTTFGGWYNNVDGPNSPEVAGYLEVSNSNGTITYTPKNPPVATKQFSILKELAGCPDALERLQVFTFGWVAAKLLDYQIPSKEDSDWPNEYFNAVRKTISHWPGAPHRLRCDAKRAKNDIQQIEDDAKRDAWEKLIPEDIKELLNRCCAYDPLKRPTLLENIKTLKDCITSLTQS